MHLSATAAFVVALVCCGPALAQQPPLNPLERAAQMQFCADRRRVAMAAETYRRIGWSQKATTEQLTSEFAYGPGGQVYRRSGAAEALVRGIVAATYAGIDYTGDEAYLRCVQQIRRASQDQDAESDRQMKKENICSQPSLKAALIKTFNSLPQLTKDDGKLVRIDAIATEDASVSRKQVTCKGMFVYERGDRRETSFSMPYNFSGH